MPLSFIQHKLNKTAYTTQAARYIEMGSKSAKRFEMNRAKRKSSAHARIQKA